MKSASLTELTCLEELIKKLLQKEVIDKEVIKQLFNCYSQSFA
jgi:hypothetical protein